MLISPDPVQVRELREARLRSSRLEQMAREGSVVAYVVLRSRQPSRADRALVEHVAASVVFEARRSTERTSP